jgi:hypothetical protein
MAQKGRGVLMTSAELHPEITAVPGDGLAAEWRPIPGAQVEIRRSGRVVGSGTVDVASADCGRVWLAAEGVESRRLFDKGEGYEVLPLSSALSHPGGVRGPAPSSRRPPGNDDQPSTYARTVVL